jgi:hypothetical protein
MRSKKKNTLWNPTRRNNYEWNRQIRLRGEAIKHSELRVGRQWKQTKEKWETAKNASV